MTKPEARGIPKREPIPGGDPLGMVSAPMDFVDYLFHCGGEDIIQLANITQVNTLIRRLRAKYDKRDDIEVEACLDTLTVKIALYLPK